MTSRVNAKDARCGGGQEKRLWGAWHGQRVNSAVFRLQVGGAVLGCFLAYLPSPLHHLWLFWISVVL